MQRERQALQELALKSSLFPTSLISLGQYALKVQAEFENYWSNDSCTTEETPGHQPKPQVPPMEQVVVESDDEALDDEAPEDWSSEEEDWYDALIMEARPQAPQRELSSNLSVVEPAVAEPLKSKDQSIGLDSESLMGA